MPPKSKAKGKGEKKKKDDEPKEAQKEGDTEEKGPAVVGSSVSGKTQDELWDECESLQVELDGEGKPKRYFMMERDKANRSWDNSKRRLDEAKAKMIEKQRMKQEAHKCSTAAVEEHQMKLKQLETAHHDEICELKMATVAKNSNSCNQNMEAEVELQKIILSLQADMGEKQSHIRVYIRKHEQKQRDELLQLNESYEKGAREVEVKYKRKMEIKFEENNILAKVELGEIDMTMKEHSESALVEHETVWRDLNKFLKDKHHVALENETLRLEFDALTKKDCQFDRREASFVIQNRSLSTSLQETEPHLCESRQQLTIQRKDMAKTLKRVNKITEQILMERRDLSLKYQQLELQHEQAEQEYEELQNRQAEAILDVQQQSGLKVLMLEKKINAMTEIQEREQLQLRVALAFGQGEPSAAKNIEEQFKSKDATIKGLRDDLSRDLKTNEDLVERADLDISIDKWLPRADIRKCIRKASEGIVPHGRKNVDDLMQELTSLRLSEETPV